MNIKIIYDFIIFIFSGCGIECTQKIYFVLKIKYFQLANLDEMKVKVLK